MLEQAHSNFRKFYLEDYYLSSQKHYVQMPKQKFQTSYTLIRFLKESCTQASGQEELIQHLLQLRAKKT